MRLSLNTILAATSLIGATNAIPTPTTEEGVARRSYVSGGVTCYYTCPRITNFGYFSGTSVSETSYGCVYDGGMRNLECIFDTKTGAYTGFYGSPGVTADACPTMADGPTCGTKPNGPMYFKRDKIISTRQKTAAEEAIQKRQFKPASPKRAAVEIEDQDVEEATSDDDTAA